MQPIPSWAGQYEGIRFADKGRTREGCDCWGLVVIVYAEQFGLALKSRAESYSSSKNVADTRRNVLEEKAGWKKIEEAAALPGDVLVLLQDSQPTHLGIFLAPGEMLHIETASDSVIEDYNGYYWGGRIEGIYRHPARAAAGL